MKTILLIIAVMLVAMTASADSPRHFTTFWEFIVATKTTITHYDTSLNEEEAIALPVELVDAGYACKRSPVSRHDMMVFGQVECTNGKELHAAIISCDLLGYDVHDASFNLPMKDGAHLYFGVRCSSVMVAR